MHVHSTIYYHLNTSILPDAIFDTWAVELANLQKQYPAYKHTGYMPGIFADWTGDTGMHLPVTESVLTLAEWLVRAAQNRTGATTPKSKPKRSKAASRASDGYAGDVGYKVE